MKNFASCLALSVLAAIATTGCNSAAYQSGLASPEAPELIGDTDNLDSQLSIARLQENRGQLRNATDRYQQMSAWHPENATIPHRLGIIESKAGNHDAANEHFRRSLELDPNNAEVLADWGYSLFLQGKLDEAEMALRQGLEEAPNNARVMNNLAIVLGHAGKTEQSLALFRQVSGEAAAWVNLGYIHSSLGEGEKAAECFGRALSIDDQLESAANALVQIADMRQQAEQRAARNSNIASRKSTSRKTRTEVANGVGQVVHASRQALSNEEVVVAHAAGQVRSVLKESASPANSVEVR